MRVSHKSPHGYLAILVVIHACQRSLPLLKCSDIFLLIGMSESFSASSIDSWVSTSLNTTLSLGLGISPEHFIET